MEAAITSSTFLPGGGLDGGVGGFLSPPPPNGNESLGNEGNDGKSIIDSETSSDKSLLMDFFLGGLAAGFFGFSTTGFGGATLSLNPGIINPVVDASVSISGSSSFFLSSSFLSSSFVLPLNESKYSSDPAGRHTPLALRPPLIMQVDEIISFDTSCCGLAFVDNERGVENP